MKFPYFFILVLSLFIFSCSSDDDASQTNLPTDGNNIPTVYQPIKIANYWNYETENIPVLPAGSTVVGQDKLLVDSDVVLNSFTYKKMKTEVSPTGFYGNMLNNNSLRIDGSSLKLSGSITVNLDASLPLEFNVTDFVIFKENGTVNEILSQTSPVSFENTSILPNNAKLTFVYSLKSICLGDVAPMVVKNQTYNDIKKTRNEVNLKVVLGDLSTGITILTPQNVIVSEQYYSKNIGVIKANTVVKYSAEASIAPLLANSGIPQQGEQNINDYLTTYLIN